MNFEPLDEESEKILKKLLSNSDNLKGYGFWVPKDCLNPLVLDNLIKNGYFESQKGVEYSFEGISGCFGNLTQKAKSYDELKDKYYEEKDKLITINCETYNDLKDSDLSNSNNQIGNSKSKQDITSNDEKFNFWKAIFIPILVTVVGGIIVWLITKS